MSKKSYSKAKMIVRVVSVVLLAIAAILMFTPKAGGVSLFDMYTKGGMDIFGIFTTRKIFFWICLVAGIVLPIVNEFFDFKEEVEDKDDDEDDDE